MNRDGLLSTLHGHLEWLTQHTPVLAGGNALVATTLAMFTGLHFDAALFLGAMSALVSAGVNLGARYLGPILDAAGKAHAQRWTPAPAVPAGPTRMLAIDDEAQQHTIAAQTGEILGYAVEHATTAVTALDHLAKDRGISVILLDLLMRDGGPARVWARAVRAAAPTGCVIVVVSGLDTAEAREIADVIGAPFVLKPAMPDQLADVISATKGK